MPIWTNCWVVATWTRCLYILEIHSFHPPWGVASTFINISVSICDMLRFRTLLFLFCFWEGTRSISGFWPWRRDSWHRPQECLNLVSQISWRITIQTWWWPRLVLCFWWQFMQRQSILLSGLDFCFVQLVKSPPAMRETWVQSLGWEDPLEKGTASHSSILSWRIPWTVQSMGSRWVGHDWVNFTSFRFTSSAWLCLLGRLVSHNLCLCKSYSGTITQ